MNKYVLISSLTLIIRITTMSSGGITSFDDVLVKYGEFGNYQKIIYLMYSCPYIMTSMQLMGWTFVGSELPHRCLRPGEDPRSAIHNSSTNECFLNGNETCSEYVYNTRMIGDSIAKEWNLVCENKEMTARIGSAPMVGYFFGGIIFGTLSDKIGRKSTFLFSVLLLLISSAASAFAPSATVFMILRLIVGIAIPGIETSCFVMGLELVGPSKRTMAGLICWFFESTGLLCTVAISYGLHDNWRILQGTFASPLILFLLYYFCTPESPRWLVSRGRYKEAESTINRILKSNGFDSPEENIMDILAKGNQVQEKPRHYTFIDLYRTPHLRTKSLILNWLWMILASFYYVMLLDQSDLSTNPYLGFFITVAAQLPCYLYVMFTIDHPTVGRKVSLIILLSVAGVCLISHPFIPAHSTPWYWFKFTISLLGRLSATSSFTILCLFSSEQFPTVLRGIGFSFNLTVSRIGSILAPYAIMIGPYSHVIFGVGSLIAAGLTSFLTETQGTQLPDSIEESEMIKPVLPWSKTKKSEDG